MQNVAHANAMSKLSVFLPAPQSPLCQAALGSFLCLNPTILHHLISAHIQEVQRAMKQWVAEIGMGFMRDPISSPAPH